jgi:hypothetical protein
MTLTTAGIYLFTFSIEISASVKGTINSVNLTGAGVNTMKYGATNASTALVTFNGSQVVNATATAYTLIFTATNSTFNGAVTGFVMATRIA